MVEFICLVMLVALGVKFLRTLLDKWGVIDWLQLNAPNDFIHKLMTCEFCQSFWLSLLVCLPLVSIKWYFIFIPIFSCNIR